MDVALEVSEVAERVLLPAVGRELIDDLAVAEIPPEARLAAASESRIDQAHHGVVSLDDRRGKHILPHGRNDGRQELHRRPEPPHHRGQRQIHSLAPEHPHLPVAGDVVGKLGNDHLGEKARAREPPLRRAHEPRARRRLHMVLAAPAGVLGPEMDVLVEVRRLELEATRLLVADGDALLPAARAGALGFGKVVDRHLGGQIGRDRPTTGVTSSLTGRGHEGLRRRRGLDLSGEAQKKLGRVNPFALGPELPAAELDHVVLKLLDAPTLLEDDRLQRLRIPGERRSVQRHPQG